MKESKKDINSGNNIPAKRIITTTDPNLGKIGSSNPNLPTSDIPISKPPERD